MINSCLTRWRHWDQRVAGPLLRHRDLCSAWNQTLKSEQGIEFQWGRHRSRLPCWWNQPSLFCPLPESADCTHHTSHVDNISVRSSHVSLFQKRNKLRIAIACYSYVIWVAGAWGLRIAYAIKALAIRCLHCGLMATYIAWWEGFLERAHVSSKIADVSNHRLCHIRKVLTKILQAYHQQRRPPAIFSPTQISEAPLGWKYHKLRELNNLKAHKVLNAHPKGVATRMLRHSISKEPDEIHQVCQTCQHE